MRPAIYYPWVYLKGGAERVLIELMHRSRHEWTLYTNHYESDSTFPEFAHLPVVPLHEVSVRRSISGVARAAYTLMTQRLDLGSHDSLVVVSEGLGNLIAARSTVPTSCICLTPLKVAYEPFTRQQFFTGGHRLHYRGALALYRHFEQPSWDRYRRVFCNSSETRRRLLSAHLVEEARLEVLHHGVDTTHFQPAGRREPFFLVPGRIMWQKNIELAIDAFLQFKPDVARNEFKLVIAGMVDAKSKSYFELLQVRAGGREDIRFLESPTDAALLRLYQGSHAVVFPPRCEDWGLVPLEAMACGKVVLAVDRGGPRESIVNGETGFLRLDDADAFAQAMASLAAMRPAQLERMGARSRVRAGTFSWDAFASRIDDHVEELSAAKAAPVQALRATEPMPLAVGSRA